jgi:beta-lactamase superfamily II metal-dependent hydrolase
MTAEVVFTMLPADDGDCILIQARQGEDTSTMLVDGGPAGSYRTWKPHLARLLGPRKIIDIVVVTHIDADHIGGILNFLNDVDQDVVVSKIWFNGYDQVAGAQLRPADLEAFSTKQADRLSLLLETRGTDWNSMTSKGPVCRDTVTEPVQIGLFKLNVVTPGRGKLAAVASRWDAIMAGIGVQESPPADSSLESFGSAAIDVEELASSPDTPDAAKPNGSSIGLVLETLGHRILLAGDCHADDLAVGIRGLGATSEHPMNFSIIKVSNHGAETNTSRELLSLIRSRYYCFSTDGRRRDHPNSKVIAKILKSSDLLKVFVLNYASRVSRVWNDETLMARYGYSLGLPDDDTPGLVGIKLEA